MEEKLAVGVEVGVLQEFTFNLPSRLLGYAIISKLSSDPEVDWHDLIVYFDHLLNDGLRLTKRDIINMTDRWPVPENSGKSFSYLSLKLEDEEIISKQMKMVSLSDMEELKEKLRKFYF